jgi:hypothetical protein
MIKTSTTETFSCFPTLEEEEAVEFTDTEDNQSEIDSEEIGFINHLQGICSITEKKKTPLFNMATFHSTRISSISCLRSNQINATTREPETNQPSNETNSSTYWNIIQAHNRVLQAQLGQALARIERNVKKNKDLMEHLQITKGNSNHPGFGSGDCHLRTKQA